MKGDNLYWPSRDGLPDGHIGAKVLWLGLLRRSSTFRGHADEHIDRFRSARRRTGGPSSFVPSTISAVRVDARLPSRSATFRQDRNFSRLNPTGSMIVWQAAQTGFVPVKFHPFANRCGLWQNLSSRRGSFQHRVGEMGFIPSRFFKNPCTALHRRSAVRSRSHQQDALFRGCLFADRPSRGSPYGTGCL